MDAVDPALTARAEAAVEGTPGVLAVERLRLRWLGQRVVAEVGVVVDGRLDLAQAHDIAHEVEHRLLHELDRVSSATVHVSPRAPVGAV
jgi:divalent metal cation (Fe/Co/Zn/Cd) transporter